MRAPISDDTQWKLREECVGARSGGKTGCRRQGRPPLQRDPLPATTEGLREGDGEGG